MSKSCRECHFATKEYRGPGTAHFEFSLTSEDRRPDAQLAEHYSRKCLKGVWDEGLSMSKDAVQSELARTDREHGCFFFPFQPSMLFPAAAELQKRAVENTQMKRTNLYAVLGLWLAAIGLIASVVVSIVGLAQH